MGAEFVMGGGIGSVIGRALDEEVDFLDGAVHFLVGVNEDRGLGRIDGDDVGEAVRFISEIVGLVGETFADG